MPRTAKKATKKVAKKTTARKTVAKKKTTAKRTVAKKPVSKTVAKKKVATKKATTAAEKTVKRVAPKTVKNPRIKGLSQAYTKSQIVTYIAECTELTKRDVANVFDSLSNLMSAHLKGRGPGEISIPGLMKCVVRRKPATRARKGINPFTGEEMTFKAKPARNIVKIRPLKKLKEMV